MSEIIIESLTKDDAPHVIDHLSRFFWLDEPMLRYINVDIDKDFLKMCIELIDHGVSLKAVNVNGDMVGIFLSELVDRESKALDYPPEATDDKMRSVNGILKHMNDASDIFNKNPDINCFIDGAILSVDNKYYSRGIATKLFNGLIEKCKEKNVPILKVMCSNLFTAKICTKFGLHQIYEIPYRDIELENLPSVDVPEPHSIARVFCYDFRRSNEFNSL